MYRGNGSLRISVFIAAVFALFAFVQHFFPHTASAQAGGQGDEAGVGFQWAMGALTGAGEEQKLEPIKQDTALKSGDQIRMMVELEKKCFLYVIHQNARGEFKLLFPYSLQQFATNYGVGKKYYIPQGDEWLKLDEHTGSEVFHLLASARRIEGIENLWSQYESAEAVHKPEIGKLILAEIRNVKKQNRELTTHAERPVNIGGSIRGIKPEPNPLDISTLAEEILANGFYAKAFTIDHH